jgi:hypothetical protein
MAATPRANTNTSTEAFQCVLTYVFSGLVAVTVMLAIPWLQKARVFAFVSISQRQFPSALSSTNLLTPFSFIYQRK